MILLKNLQAAMPIKAEPFIFKQSDDVGLVIIDEIHGFATVGAGALAPNSPNEQITQMVMQTNQIARHFTDNNWPIMAFQDCHEPGKAEPPYPPHCEKGSGEEELVDDLKWLEQDSNTKIIQKDCINGFIGAMNRAGENLFVNWIKEHQLTHLVFVGICTDICVMDFVLTTLSARNHGMIGDLAEILVYEPGCATYEMNDETRLKFGLPETALHPQDLSHHMGLYFMASRGAKIIDKLIY